LLRELLDQLCWVLRGHGFASGRVRTRTSSGCAVLRIEFDGARDFVDHERSRKDSSRAVAYSRGLAAANLYSSGLACGRVASRLETGFGQPDSPALRVGAHPASRQAHSPDHALG